MGSLVFCGGFALVGVALGVGAAFAVGRPLLARGHERVAVAAAATVTAGLALLAFIAALLFPRIDEMLHGPCVLCEGPGPGILLMFLAAAIAVFGLPAANIAAALLVERTPVTGPPLRRQHVAAASAVLLAVAVAGAAALLVALDVQRGRLAADLARLASPPAAPARFVERGRLLADLRTYAAGVTLSPDGRWMAVQLGRYEAAAQGYPVWLYSLDTLHVQSSVVIAGWCTWEVSPRMGFSPDGRWLASGCTVYRVPDLGGVSPAITNSLQTAFNPGATALATVADAGGGAAVTLYALPDVRRVWSARVPRAGGDAALAFERGGAVLAVRVADTFYAHLDARTGELLDSGAARDPDEARLPPVPPLPRARDVRSYSAADAPLALSADRAFAARGTPLAVWHWDGQAYQLLGAPDLTARTVITALAFASDGRVLVVATSDGWLHFLTPE